MTCRVTLKTTSLSYNLDITFSCWNVFVADFRLTGKVRRNGTRLFMSWKRTLLLCHQPQNVLLVGKTEFSTDVPGRMDEAWVTPKSLLNYREIPVVRALDRREVIGCCSAAVRLNLERIFSSIKVGQLLPLHGVHFSLAFASLLYSFPFFKFTLQFYKYLLSFLYLFFF